MLPKWPMRRRGKRPEPPSRKDRSGPSLGGIAYPTRRHGAAERRKLWAAFLETSEAKLAWWQLDEERFGADVAKPLPGWRAESDEDCSHLTHTFRTSGRGEAILFAHFASHLHTVAESPSQLHLILSHDGSVEARLYDEEGERITLDESWMACMLTGALRHRRRKQSRLRRGWLWIVRRLGGGPARLPGEELTEGLASRGWTSIERAGRCLCVQQGYLFDAPDLALHFTGEVAALLDYAWEDLRCGLGLAGEVATVNLHSHRRAWPPAGLLDAMDSVDWIARSHGGEGQDLSAVASKVADRSAAAERPPR